MSQEFIDSNMLHPYVEGSGPGARGSVMSQKLIDSKILHLYFGNSVEGSGPGAHGNFALKRPPPRASCGCRICVGLAGCCKHCASSMKCSS